jgi:ribosomal protein L22
MGSENDNENNSERKDSKIENKDNSKEKSEESKTDNEKKEARSKKNDERENKEEVKKENEAKRIHNEARVTGKDLSISMKHSIAVCNFIRGESTENAIRKLEQVEKLKQPIPMRGEIPHRKGMMSGRYPVNAVKEFIKLLRGLNSDAIAKEMELEKYVIFCKANIARRPYKRFGKGRMKRTHVELKLESKEKKNG